jgi:hypothetical protein
MRRWIHVLAVCCLFDVAMAAEKVRDISWSELKAAGQILSGLVIGGEGSQPEWPFH